MRLTEIKEELETEIVFLKEQFYASSLEERLVYCEYLLARCNKELADGTVHCKREHYS